MNNNWEERWENIKSTSDKNLDEIDIKIFKNVYPIIKDLPNIRRHVLGYSSEKKRLIFGIQLKDNKNLVLDITLQDYRDSTIVNFFLKRKLVKSIICLISELQETIKNLIKIYFLNENTIE